MMMSIEQIEEREKKDLELRALIFQCEKRINKVLDIYLRTMYSDKWEVERASKQTDDVLAVLRGEREILIERRRALWGKK